MGEKGEHLKGTGANLVLEHHLDELGLRWTREAKFYFKRKWRADYAISANGDNVLIEIEGAVWANGRHTRGSGYVKDLEKYNMASALGYKLFRFTTQQVLSGEAKEWLAKNWLCR